MTRSHIPTTRWAEFYLLSIHETSHLNVPTEPLFEILNFPLKFLQSEDGGMDVHLLPFLLMMSSTNALHPLIHTC